MIFFISRRKNDYGENELELSGIFFSLSDPRQRKGLSPADMSVPGTTHVVFQNYYFLFILSNDPFEIRLCCIFLFLFPSRRLVLLFLLRRAAVVAVGFH